MIKNKLYLLRVKCTSKGEDGKEIVSIDTYIGSISPMNRNKYFEGAWFDENNQFVSAVTLSKEQFNKEAQCCRELSVSLSENQFKIEA